MGGAPLKRAPALCIHPLLHSEPTPLLHDVWKCDTGKSHFCGPYLLEVCPHLIQQGLLLGVIGVCLLLEVSLQVDVKTQEQVEWCMCQESQALVIFLWRFGTVHGRMHGLQARVCC